MRVPVSLSKKATNQFLKLIDGLDLVTEETRKLDNAPGIYMPLHIEVILHGHGFAVLSFAHYGEQNGDLMRDPEMTFYVQIMNSPIIGEMQLVYPMSYQNDYAAAYSVSMEILEDGKLRFDPREQRDHARFAHLWMKNLNEQQLKP